MVKDHIISFYRVVLIVIVLSGFLHPAFALEVDSVSIRPNDQGTDILIQFDRPLASHDVVIAKNPTRIVLDVPLLDHPKKVSMPADYSGDLVRKLRAGFHDETSSRLVFELNADASSLHVTSRRSKNKRMLYLEVRSKPEKSALPNKTIATNVKSTPPVSKTKLKPVIVIDAGHGGEDPGAFGVRGSQEKDLTLTYSKLLKDALLKTGRYSVSLTREDDRYLLLPERVKRARAAKGDLFISIHANSDSSKQASGFSVYTISDVAADKESEALAAKENKADVIGGMDLSDASKDVADILINLAERETRAKSSDFADLLIQKLEHHITLLHRSHRFAGFAVLKAPDIPSVLIEIGFLSHAKEERLLHTASHQKKIIQGLVNAIDSFFSKKKH